MQWHSPTTLGQTPSCRSGHSATMVGSNMLVFGGYEQRYLNELVQLSTDNWEWTPLQPHGAAPSRRGWHSSTLFGNNIYIYGGYGSSWLNDITMLDLETLQWITPTVRGHPPPPLRGHTASVVGSNIVVMGGGTADTTEVYLFDTRTQIWTQPQVTGDAPPARFGQACAGVSNRLLVVGGHHGGVGPIDFAVLDASIMRWTRPAQTGSVPTVRGWHSATLLERKLLVLGGYGSTCTNEMYTFDVDDYVWEQPAVRGTAPPARESHSAVISGGRLIVFGGYDGENRYNDLRVLDTGAGSSGPDDAQAQLARTERAARVEAEVMRQQALRDYTDVRSQLQEARSAIKTLEYTVHDTTSAASESLQAKQLFKTERSARLDAEAMRQQALKDYADIQEQLQEARNTIARLQVPETARAQLESQFGMEKKKREEAEAALNETTAQLQAKLSELQAEKDSKSTLDMHLQAERKGRDDAETALRAAQVSLQAKTADLQVAEDTKHTLETRLSSEHRLRQEAEASLGTTQVSLKYEGELRHDLEQRVAALTGKLKEAQQAWDDVDNDRARLEAQVKGQKRIIAEQEHTRVMLETNVQRELAGRQKAEQQCTKLQQNVDDLNAALAKIQRDAEALNMLMQSSEAALKLKYEKMQAMESRVGRLEGLLTSLRELVELKQEAALARLQTELEVKRRSEHEARESLETALLEAASAKSEITKMQATLAASEDTARAAQQAIRQVEEGAQKDVQRWRAKAAKYRTRKMQAEEMLRMEVSTRPGSAGPGGPAGMSAADLKAQKVRTNQLEMEKLRAEEALKVERERWQVHESEMRTSLETLRMQSIQADVARFRREDGSPAPPVSIPRAMSASRTRPLSASGGPVDLQMLSRGKAVMLEHTVLPASKPRSKVRR